MSIMCMQLHASGYVNHEWSPTIPLDRDAGDMQS